MKLENISKNIICLNEEKTILENITYHFEPGKIYLILGKEQSGKTTLPSIIGLTNTFNEGTYLIDDINVSSLSKKEKREFINQKIGFLFPGGYLHHKLSVTENLLLPLKNKKKDIAYRKLQEEGLLELKDKYPLDLTEKERIHVALIRALMNSPKYILADEPTINLTENEEEFLFIKLKELAKKGCCVILTSKQETHKKYADKVLYLIDKELKEEPKC